MSTPTVTATTGDVERTARDTAWAQWGVAVVVMVGSMAAGGVTFHDLGEPAALGVVTALAVDLALAAWLRIASRLRALGVTSPRGWVLEATTAAMTLFLNVGAAVFNGINPASATARGLLAVAHSFLPIVLVLVTLAGSQAQLKLLTLRRQRELRDHTERTTRLAAQTAQHETDQRRITAERDADNARRARVEQIRLAELTAEHHQREIADRRDQRALTERHLVASVASVLALGAAWRARPHPPPRTSTQVRARRVPTPRTPPVPATPPRPAPVSVTEELLAQARHVRAHRAAHGKTCGRAVLQRELSIPENTARQLARRLGTTPTTPDPPQPHTTTTPTEPEGKAA